MEALQDSPPGPVEGVDEDIADKVGPGLVAGLAGVLGEVCRAQWEAGLALWGLSRPPADLLVSGGHCQSRQPQVNRKGTPVHGEVLGVAVAIPEPGPRARLWVESAAQERFLGEGQPPSGRGHEAQGSGTCRGQVTAQPCLLPAYLSTLLPPPPRPPVSASTLLPVHLPPPPPSSPHLPVHPPPLLLPVHPPPGPALWSISALPSLPCSPVWWSGHHTSHHLLSVPGSPRRAWPTLGLSVHALPLQSSALPTLEASPLET